MYMLGENIRKSRKKASITQEQLAKMIGVKRSVISKYENGMVDPSFSQLQRIADSLGINITELVDINDVSPSLNAAIPLVNKAKEISKRSRAGGAIILSDEDKSALTELAALLGKVPDEISNNKIISDELKHEYDNLFDALNLHGKALAVTIVAALASDPNLQGE